MNVPDERLNQAINAFRDYLQSAAHDAAALREISHNAGQRMGQLTADVEMLRQELHGLHQESSGLESLRQEFVAALDQADRRHGQQVEELRAALEALGRDASGLESLRQEFVATLDQADRQRGQQAEQLTATVDTLRQEFLASVREGGDARSQRLDQLAADLETMSAELLAKLREAAEARDLRFDHVAAELDKLREQQSVALEQTGDAHDSRLDQLAAGVDTLRQEWQDLRHTLPDVEALRREYQTMAPGNAQLDTLRQEWQGIRQSNSEMERSLRSQLSRAKEQLDTHTHDLATLTERVKAQGHEVSEQIQTLTNLVRQEHAQRETALTTLGKLHEEISGLKQKIDTSETRSADTLREDQNRLTALEKWLAAQGEQFGRFDPVLRELHGGLVSTHQRLVALEETTAGRESVGDHEQRLTEAEQQSLSQAAALGEVRETLEQWVAQAAVMAGRNRQLMGALAVMGLVIMILLAVLILK